MAVIAFLVWLDSPGKVIFAQERLGLHGRRFRMYKFRKFPVHWRDAGPAVTAADDTRMTRMGRILERTKLDELPQLWNILKGEMSFVGPRPESTRFADLFSGRYVAILDYVPGIFGPNQANYRNESELYPADEGPETYYRRVLFPQKVERDLVYFKNADCLSDLRWILLGIWVTLTGIINWRRAMTLYTKVLVVDVLLIELGWVLTNVFRFGSLPEGRNLEVFISGTWIFPLILVSGMLVGGCYFRPFRYFSLVDAIRLTWIVTITWLLGFVFLIGFVSRNASLYLIPMGWLALLPLLAMPRVWIRIQAERSQTNDTQQQKQILIYGAGKGGIALVSWIRQVPMGLHVVGLIDDDSELRGMIIAGYRVLGRESDIPTIQEVHKIDEVWVTYRLKESKLNRLKAYCTEHDVILVVFPELEPFSRFCSAVI
jgi:lipopolysaccharide/colanic/teichoic acid biosynthesis glycosyltransferase